MQRACAVALPVVAVLAVDPWGLAPFGPLKWMLVPAVVLAGAAAAWWRGAPGPGRPWLAMLAVVAVSAALGADPVYAWIGTPERRFGVVAWAVSAAAFVLGRSLDDRGRRLLGAAGTVAVAGAGVWATAEVLGWRPIDLVGAGERAVGPLGSSAYLGAAAALLAPVALGVALDRRRGWWAAPALGAVALVASGARAAWFGAVVAAVAVAVTRRRVPRPAVAAAVGLVALAVLTGVAGRVPDVVTDRDGGLRGRLDEWRVAARVIADAPLLGHGPEGYRIAFGANVDDAYEQEHGRHPLPDRAHSAPLDVAATTGVAGLAAWLVLLGAVGRHVWRALPTSYVAAGVVAYAAQSLFLFPLAELDPVAWCLAGTLVASGTRPPRPARPLAVAAAAAAVVALAAGGLDVVADRRAADGLATAAELRPDALRYRLLAARTHEEAGRLGTALEQLDLALDVSPRDPVVRGERARLLLDLDPDRALAALEDLAGDDPRNAEVLLRLGVARARTGDLDGAIAAWRRAERLAPDSRAATANIARAEAERGRDGT